MHSLSERPKLIVPSFTFLAFALACALVFNLSAARWWRQSVLLFANIYFIQSFCTSWLQLIPYIGFLALGYLMSVMRAKGLGRHAWIFPLAILAVFVWLKKYLFVPTALLLPNSYLIVGLSFVFFRVMHMVLDGWEMMPKGAAGVASYVNYSLNFTSLVSGPIQRFEDYLNCESGKLRLGEFEIGRALERIVTGFFKVYILSSLLGSFRESQIALLSASQPSLTRIVEGALIAGLYPIYLYFNFSGYTDFVIGVARFFRIELPENFDRPFLAGNIIAFWGRWHMTLTNWLKTYVYSPLLMTLLRRFPSPKIEIYLGVIAYFVTFFLVGFWHGQTSEFFVFGVLQGGGVAANKLYQIFQTRRMGRAAYAKLCKNPVYLACMRGVTFTWYAFTSVWFWASWENIRDLMSSLGWLDAIGIWLVIYIAATIIITAVEQLGQLALAWRLGQTEVVLSRYTRTAWTTAMALVIVVVSVVLSAPAPQIVYKAF